MLRGLQSRTKMLIQEWENTIHTRTHYYTKYTNCKKCIYQDMKHTYIYIRKRK